MTTGENTPGTPAPTPDMQATITAILQPLFAQLKTDLVTYVDQSLTNLAPTQPTETETDTADTADADLSTVEGLRAALQATNAKLAGFEQTAANEKKAAAEARLDSALSEFAAGQKILAPGLFKDALLRRTGDKFVEVDGAWYIKNGEQSTSLSDHLTSFMGTDEGKALLPSTGINGASTKETSSTQPVTQPTTSADDALMLAYRGIV